MTLADVEQMIHKVDNDGNGQIGFEEWCRLIIPRQYAEAFAASPDADEMEEMDPIVRRRACSSLCSIDPESR